MYSCLSLLRPFRRTLSRLTVFLLHSWCLIFEKYVSSNHHVCYYFTQKEHFWTLKLVYLSRMRIIHKIGLVYNSHPCYLRGDMIQRTDRQTDLCNPQSFLSGDQVSGGQTDRESVRKRDGQDNQRLCMSTLTCLWLTLHVYA
jgi:hypothetical protein